MKQRFHTVAYGNVQGVGFRAFVRHHAIRLDIAGHVRNRDDGAVVTEAEGAPENAAQLLRLIQRGPRHSHVSRLEHLPPGTDPLPSPFAILR